MRRLALLAALTAALQTSAQPISASGDTFRNLRVTGTERVAVLDAGVAMINGPLQTLGHVHIGDDGHIDTNDFLYMNGITRTVGFTFDGTNMKLVNAAGPFTPNSDQATNLGSSTVRWSDTYSAEYHLNAARMISSTAPTIASGFGTSPAVAASNGTAAFRITVGNPSGATGAITLPAATTGWRCSCDDVTTQSATVFLTKQTASSTTSCTVGNFDAAGASQNWVAGDGLICGAMAY